MTSVVALTRFVFGSPVWVYVVTIQVTYGAWLSEHLPYANVFPFNSRPDDLGMIAFAVAVVGFCFGKFN